MHAMLPMRYASDRHTRNTHLARASDRQSRTLCLLRLQTWPAVKSSWQDWDSSQHTDLTILCRPSDRFVFWKHVTPRHFFLFTSSKDHIRSHGSDLGCSLQKLFQETAVLHMPIALAEPRGVASRWWATLYARSSLPGQTGPASGTEVAGAA